MRRSFNVNVSVNVNVIAGIVVACALGAGCGTVRGLLDEGRVADACHAADFYANPWFDDDDTALAARVRLQLPGSVTARVVDVAAVAGDAPLLRNADIVEVVVDAPSARALAGFTAIDKHGLRLPAERLDTRTLLAMFGAPLPPQPTYRSSTSTPGPFESLMKVIGIAVVGIPVSMMTLGTVSPDLGGLFSTGPSTSTWAEDSPELPAWRARNDVVTAARVGHALGLDADECAAGRCRTMLVVPHAASFAAVRTQLSLDVGGCTLVDDLTIPLHTTTPLSQTAPDTQQWRRFADTNYGLDPFLRDVGDAADDCCDDLLCGC